MEYFAKAFGTWFMGFFPLTEIYFAVPAGLATGLDELSVIFWAVLGNIVPIVLIHYGFDSFIRPSRFGQWLERSVSDGVKAKIQKYGVFFVLVITPWVGVWLMAVTVKLMGMSYRRFAPAALVSITVYAIAITWMIRTGANALG